MERMLKRNEEIQGNNFRLRFRLIYDAQNDTRRLNDPSLYLYNDKVHKHEKASSNPRLY